MESEYSSDIVRTTKLCADKTGLMQRLTTAYKLVLSEKPQFDHVAWDREFTPSYTEQNTSDLPCPIYAQIK